MMALEKYRTKPIVYGLIGAGVLMMFPMFLAKGEPGNFAVFSMLLSIPAILAGLIAQVVFMGKHNREIAYYKREVIEKGVFRFKIENPTPDLMECERGESVNHWQPADDKGKMFFYQKGTFSGDGKLGNAPPEYVKLINSILAKGLHIQAFVFGDEIEIKIIDLTKELKEKR